MEQVIDFDEEGCAVALRFPRGKGVDLRNLGTVTTERTSDIQIYKDTQRFAVSFLRGQREGTYMTWGDIADASPSSLSRLLFSDGHPVLPPEMVHPEMPALFADYEDAIPYEVLVVQYLRTTQGEDYL